MPVRRIARGPTASSGDLDPGRPGEALLLAAPGRGESSPGEDGSDPSSGERPGSAGRTSRPGFRSRQMSWHHLEHVRAPRAVPLKMLPERRQHRAADRDSPGTLPFPLETDHRTFPIQNQLGPPESADVVNLKRRPESQKRDCPIAQAPGTVGVRCGGQLPQVPTSEGERWPQGTVRASRPKSPEGIERGRLLQAFEEGACGGHLPEDRGGFGALPSCPELLLERPDPGGRILLGRMSQGPALLPEEAGQPPQVPRVPLPPASGRTVAGRSRGLARGPRRPCRGGSGGRHQFLVPGLGESYCASGSKVNAILARARP